MSRTFTALHLEIAEGVAEVRLGDATGSSRATAATATDLLELSHVLTADRSVRAVLLQPRGADFTSGGDIDMFHAMREEGLAAGLRRMLDSYHRAVEHLAALDAPIVAAVRGAAAGGGLGLVCLADVVVSADDATYSMGSSAIGLSADGGTSWYLPRLIGMRRAQELLLLNRRLTAAEALDWGLVTRVEPSDHVDEVAREVARRLAAGPTVAIGELRRLLRESHSSSLSQQLKHETESLVVSASSEDAAAGIEAFTLRQRPNFAGR
jgi:2-(1,2-epoxy-1,2-dihydrophenyl)acetyl-CoA isomerase